MRTRAVLAVVAMAGLSGTALAWAGRNPGAMEGGVILLRGGSHTTQGYLGVDIRDVGEEQVSSLKLKDGRGAEVIRVDHDGPACTAGVRQHDVILELNGKRVDGEDALRRMLRETPAGRQVKILINRDGQEQTISAQMANREDVEREAWDHHWSVPDPAVEAKAPDAPAEPAGQGGPGGAVRGTEPASRARGLGFLHSPGALSNGDGVGHSIIGTSLLKSKATGVMLEMISTQLAEFFGTSTGAGLLVRNVDANGPAQAAGIKAGDVVVRVNQVPMVSPGDWTKAVRENRGRQVDVVLVRDRHEQTLTMTLDGKRRSCLEIPRFFSMSRPVGADSGAEAFQ